MKSIKISTKKVIIKANKKNEYKKLSKQLKYIAEDVYSIKKRIDELYKKINEAIKDANKGNAPIIDDMYTRQDYLSFIPKKINQIEQDLDYFADQYDEIENM